MISLMAAFCGVTLALFLIARIEGAYGWSYLMLLLNIIFTSIAVHSYV